MATSLAGAPVMKQVCGPEGYSSTRYPKGVSAGLGCNIISFQKGHTVYDSHTDLVKRKAAQGGLGLLLDSLLIVIAGRPSSSGPFA